MISSGKGTIAKHLKEKHNASVYRFSTMLRDVLNRLYCEVSRENMQFLSTLLRKKFGEDLLAKVIARDVENDKNKLIVVDGARRIADIKYLKKIDGFKLVKVGAHPELRYKRLVARGENTGDAQKTYEEFIIEGKKETEVEIPVIMEKAEIEINNDNSLQELYKQIDILINKLKKSSL